MPLWTTSNLWYLGFAQLSPTYTYCLHTSTTVAPPSASRNAYVVGPEIFILSNLQIPPAAAGHTGPAVSVLSRARSKAYKGP